MSKKVNTNESGDAEKEAILKDAKELAELLNSKKANNIVLLDVAEQTPIADFFLIVSAESFIHSRALEDYSKKHLEVAGYKRLNISNIYPENPWILLDYGEIIVHIFMQDARVYYELEKLWYDSKKISLELK